MKIIGVTITQNYGGKFAITLAVEDGTLPAVMDLLADVALRTEVKPT